MLWLPYLVKRSPDASWEWWWPWWCQRSSEVKWGQLCAIATIFGQKKPWCKLRMMMTSMEVKGHQRSNGVNYLLWLPYLVKRSPDASWEWWWPWWRSKVIRGQMGSTMCYDYHIWSKEALMQAENDDDLVEVKGHQRSNGVNYVLWLPYLVKRSADASWEWWWPLWRSKVIRGQMEKLCAMANIFCQKKCWCKLKMMMTLMEVKGHQRSNGVNYVLWLPYFVKRSADANWEWWWPLWRSKVIRGQMG